MFDTPFTFVYPTTDAPHQLTSYNPSASLSHHLISTSIVKIIHKVIVRDNETMSNDRKSANRLFLPPSDFDLQGSGFEPPYVSDQRQGGNEANNRNDLESATSTNSEEDEYEYFNTEPRVMHQVSSSTG